ncbi:MAG: hypothetical protein WAM82_08485 [Thermoanaerobaculia bacterium]
MKKHARRLTLHRETLLRLEDAPLRALAGGNVPVWPETQDPACYSPLCMPTFWKTCETQIG